MNEPVAQPAFGDWTMRLENVTERTLMALVVRTSQATDSLRLNDALRDVPAIEALLSRFVV